MSWDHIQRWRRGWARLLRNDSGQGLIEYALVVGIVSLGAVTTLGFVSGKIQALIYSSANNGAVNSFLCADRAPNSTSPGCTAPTSGSTIPGGTFVEDFSYTNPHNGKTTDFTCHYTVTYAYYAAGIVKGHGGDESDLEGLYSAGKLPAADDDSLCGVSGFVAGTGDYGGLPSNPPHSWNINGYTITCTWHGDVGVPVGSGGSSPPQFWTVDPGKYFHGCFAGPIPSMLQAPSMSPSSAIKVGATLTGSPGSWDHNPTGFVYQWFSCSDSSGTNCTHIAGADDTGDTSTYVLTEAAYQRYIKIQVVASNPDGQSAPQFSTAVGSVGADGSVNTTRPTFTPTSGAVVGTLLNNTNGVGTWTGSPTISYAWQWMDCDASGGNCSPVAAGAGTSGTDANVADYTVRSSDGAKTIKLQVTATNFVGSVTVLSTAVTNVIPVPTAPTGGPPTITVHDGICSSNASLAVGSCLVAAPGTWSGYPATFNFTYAWFRCDSVGSNCDASPFQNGAGTTYHVVSSDAGRTFYVQVTVSNGVNPNGVAVSNKTGMVPYPTALLTVNASWGQANAADNATVTAIGGPTGNTYTGTISNGTASITVPQTTSGSYTVTVAKNGATSSVTNNVLVPSTGTTITAALTPTKVLTITVQRGGALAPNTSVKISVTGGPIGGAGANPAASLGPVTTTSSSTVQITLPAGSGTYTVKVYLGFCSAQNRSGSNTVSAAAGATAVTVNMTSMSCPPTLP